MENRILVIGGGPAGLTAAIFAARNGAAVTVLEHNERPGKKLSATGNGKGNFTNQIQEKECYRCSEADFPSFALSAFPLKVTLQFFEELGMHYVNKGTGYYPASRQAGTLTDLLLLEARRLRIKIKTREHVTAIKKSSEHTFEVLTETWHYDADKVILAAGSNASAIQGADGSGYGLAKALGHTVLTPLPALVPLKCKGKKFSSWSGTRVQGKVTLLINGEEAASSAGELQLTEYGISGIPVFQISRYAVRALEEKKKVTAVLDFLPEYSLEEVTVLLKNRKEACPHLQNTKEFLLGIFPDKLIPVLAAEKDLASAIHSYSLTVTGSQSADYAQVCTGGVSCSEIDPETLQSRLISGLYFAGEVLDIDGACGGYNLQWAWSSGFCSGTHAALS